MANISCISFDSYIKPQLITSTIDDCVVVYLLTPTSNHNFIPRESYFWGLYIFWLLHQTTTYFDLFWKHEELYIFWLLHQTTTTISLLLNVCSCISFDSYIKPQQWVPWCPSVPVVYLLTPTSNHNWCSETTIEQMLYIFWLLHQTTTEKAASIAEACCISFDSYIKPQLLRFLLSLLCVVYLLTPTSNHNYIQDGYKLQKLYIFWLLHQTTTLMLMHLVISSCISFDSYIKPQLVIIRTCRTACCISFDSYIKPQRIGICYFSTNRCISFDSYIKPQLANAYTAPSSCCISFDSYIKPQRNSPLRWNRSVVYLLTPTSNHNRLVVRIFSGRVVYLLTPTSNHNMYRIVLITGEVVYLLTPTSNHNSREVGDSPLKLYIFWLLHQTTTVMLLAICLVTLYIFWLLHQTTTLMRKYFIYLSCISFDSYIKPQLLCYS